MQSKNKWSQNGPAGIEACNLNATPPQLTGSLSIHAALQNNGQFNCALVAS